VVGDHAFAVYGEGLAANGILRALLPVGGPWTPSWSVVVPEDAENPTDFVQAGANGRLLAVYRGLPGFSGDTAPFVRVYDPVSMNQVGESTFPDPLLRIVLSLASDSTRLYAIVTADTFGATPRFFRASLDPSTGALSQWSDRTNNIGLSPNERMTNVSVLPDGRILIAADRYYVSLNQGTSFSPYGAVTGIPDGRSDLCVAGSTLILGENRSLDGGTTWEHPLPGIPPSERGTAPFPCAILPTTPRGLLVSHPQGALKTADITTAAPTWNDASSGLDGINVKFGAVNRAAPQYGVFVTAAGLAVSATLTDPSPQWRYPTCPTGAPCSGAAERATVVFDPTDAATFYYVASDHTVYRGTISTAAPGPPAVVWNVFAPRPPSEDGGDPSIRIFPTLPDLLAVTSRRATQSSSPSLDGNLRFYRRSDGVELRTVLDNLPVQDVAAITGQLLFASVRHDLTNVPSTQDPQGLYKSLDGGVTWQPATFPVEVLGGRPNILEFRYDAPRDTLYARGKKSSAPAGFFFYLPQASTGTDDWQLAERATFPNLESGVASALTLDPLSGVVYLALQRQIYGSGDRGRSWNLLLTGFTGELITSLDFVPEPGTSLNRLATGSNAGAQRFSSDIAPPTPTPAPLCRLTAGKNCKSKTAPGCTLNGSLGFPDGTPIVAPVRLEGAPKKSAKKWKTIKKGNTSALGRWSRTVKRTIKSYYRLRSSNPACTTKPLLVKPNSR
jgi:hypothetical protein